MAGVQAGTAVGVEFIVEMAQMYRELERAGALVDRTTARMAQDMKEVDRAVANTGLSARQMAREAQRIKDAIDPLGQAQRRYAQELRTANALLMTGALNEREFASAVEMAEAKLDQQTMALQRNGKVSGQSRAGMQQLTFQLNDMATMWSMGAKPMQIFASQSGQVVQAISMMQGGASRFTTFMMGPWGAALTVGVLVLTPLIGKLFEAEKATDSFTQALREQTSEADRATEALRRLQSLQKSTVSGDIMINQMELNKRRDRLSEIENELSRPASRMDKIIGWGEGWSVPLKQEAEQLRWEMIELQGAIDAGNASLKIHEQHQKDTASAVATATHATAGRVRGLAEEERALANQIRETERYIAALEEEIEKIGLGPAQLRQLEIARAKDAAATDAQREAIELLNAAREEKYSNIAREAALAEMAKEKAAEELDLITKEAKQIEEATRRANDELRDMAQLLNRIGGAGGVLGSIFAILGGDFNGIASGPVGDILAQVLNQTGDDGKKIGQHVADELEEVFDKVFGANGLFGQTLTQALTGAGLGYAASSALGMKGTGSGVGSSLGGILGQAVGSKVFTFLGSAAGPVGAIVGGLLGGLVGGLFGGTKKGVVGIGGSGADLSVYGTKHSNSERVAQATAAADSIISTITDLAKTLGGAVNAAKASVTIGMRNDSFVVDTAGQGRTEGAGVMNFGKDQAAAVKAAMMDLIKDGVISGVRDSTMRLLQQSGDFEAALEKAIAWESILKNAETSGNSFAAEMKALGVQLEAVAQLAREAGASTAELAQVQEFMIRQQQALIDQATATYRSTFYSDAENVAFAKQTIAATLGPLGFGDVNTVAKYRALVEATDAVANPELYGTLMDLADEFGVLKDAAEAAAQASQLAAAAKKAEAEATLNAAKDVLRQAYQSESAALRETIDAASRAAETLAEFRDSLWGTEGAVGDVSRLWSKFVSLGMRANSGDLTAAGQLPGSGKDYLDAKRLSATSMVEYQRAVAMVARYTTGAIGAALDQKTDAEMQLAAMEEQVGKLIDIDNSVISVEQAIERLTALQRPAGGGGETREEAKTRRERVASLLQQVRDRLQDIEINTAVGAVGSSQTARRLHNLEYNGKLLVSTEEPS